MLERMSAWGLCAGGMVGGEAASKGLEAEVMDGH